MLAHIRLNDRTDVDGKRVLFVEEIQSDWAQRGGTDGFGQQPRYTVRDTNGHVRGDFTTRDAAQAYLDNPPERMRHLFDHTARVVQVGQARVERAVAAEREADDTLEAAKSLLLKYKGDLAEANATHRRAGEQARTADEVEAAMQWLTKAKLKHELQTSVLKEANVTLIAAMRERDEAQAATTMGTGTPVAPFVAKREFAVFKDGAEVKRIDKDGKPQTERYGSMELAQAAAQKKGGEARDMGYGEHTDAWVALAIKRVLKLAVDEGYDKVAFINGQQSADRYGLTQVFDQLMYVHNQTDDTYTLGVKRVGAHENDAFQTEVGGRDMRVLKAADLPGYVDKELADKIVAGEGVRGTFGGAAHYVDYAVGPAIIGDGQVVFGVRADGTRQMVDANAADPEAKARELRRELGARGPLVLKGIDLKVGGEDMKVFYDSIVPKIATRISKKLGGGAMGVVNIQVGKNFETRSRSEAERDGGSFGRVEAPAMGDQPSIDITDKMREQAAGGVPLFARQSQGAYSGAYGQAPAQQAPGPGDGSALPGAAARADDGVRGAAGAVPDRAARGDRAGSGRRTLGLGIAERIERTGHEALNGAIVRGPQDLADLAQVFRDPRYETFRVFFVKGNTIVHSTGVSSRSVDATSAAPAGVSSQEYHQRMKDMKDSTKADGYYILHNHPSGEPTASKEDIELTASLAAAVPGLMAHVIVNSNKWGLIEPDSSGAITTAETHIRQFGEDKLLQASKPLAVLGRALGKAEDLAVLGKAVQKPGYITLIGTDAGNRVRVVTEVPSDVLKRSDKYLLALVRRVKRLSGSANMHAVGSDSDMASEPIVRALTARVLRDALPETGLPLSKRIAQVPKKDAPSIESPAREAKGPDVLADNYKGLEGKKVDMPVRLADTGETGTLTLDAAGALRDYDDRIGALRRLTECLA